MAKPYRGVFLTDAGESLAARVRARHRVVVDLLLAVGVPFEAAESDAEGIEHHVSDTDAGRIRAVPAARRVINGLNRRPSVHPVGG